MSVTDFDFFALQLTPAGKLDPSFNPTGPTPGINRFDFGASSADFVGSATLNPDGRILITGSNATTGGAEVAWLIGTVEQARTLAIGGSLDGKGQVFTPAVGTGSYAAAAGCGRRWWTRTGTTRRTWWWQRGGLGQRGPGVPREELRRGRAGRGTVPRPVRQRRPRRRRVRRVR